MQIDAVGNAQNRLEVTWDNGVEEPSGKPYRAMSNVGGARPGHLLPAPRPRAQPCRGGRRGAAHVPLAPATRRVGGRADGDRHVPQDPARETQPAAPHGRARTRPTRTRPVAPTGSPSRSSRACLPGRCRCTIRVPEGFRISSGEPGADGGRRDRDAGDHVRPRTSSWSSATSRRPRSDPPTTACILEGPSGRLRPRPARRDAPDRRTDRSRRGTRQPMDLRRQGQVVRSWLWLLVAGVLLAGGTAYLVSSSLPKVYEAQATLLVGESSPSSGIDYNDLLASQRLSQTYANWRPRARSWPRSSPTPASTPRRTSSGLRDRRGGARLHPHHRHRRGWRSRSAPRISPTPSRTS